jgi:hypothetical protein
METPFLHIDAALRPPLLGVGLLVKLTRLGHDYRMAQFGDYIIYVDESGDHSLGNIDPHFPVFVLAFCIFPIDSYVNDVVPSVGHLKFGFFGHDMIVLHERDIRKSLPPFDILLNASTREAFLGQLNEVVENAPFKVVACVIRKERLNGSKFAGRSPYHVALEFGLERVYMHLQGSERGKKTHVIFESRGKKEDQELELEFRRIMDRTTMEGMPETLEFRCASKQANSSGLQLADMVARPIGLKQIRPEQPNRAWDIIEPKLRRSPSGQVSGWGLKIYP